MKREKGEGLGGCEEGEETKAVEKVENSRTDELTPPYDVVLLSVLDLPVREM